MDKCGINEKATWLHRKIWRNRHEIWPYGHPSPVEMLNPEVACEVLNIEYQVHEELGSSFGFRGSRFKIAGSADRQLGRISVANSFAPQEVRFTAAHEIGHWLLHPQEAMFRDRPISNMGEFKRPQIEKEADYFAACYLMPEKLLKREFTKRFRAPPFHFNDQTARLLSPQDPDTLSYAEEGSMDRALTLAKCSLYNSVRFYSLAYEFKVSAAAMAIRLEELRFIKWP